MISVYTAIGLFLLGCTAGYLVGWIHGQSSEWTEED